jgi:hypothetical protein
LREAIATAAPRCLSRGKTRERAEKKTAKTNPFAVQENKPRKAVKSLGNLAIR